MVYVEYYTTATDGSLIEAMGDRSVVILDGRNSLQTMKLDAVFHNGRYRPFYKAYRICKEIYKTLEDEYNYSQSDEAITELCTINDWEFLENGEQYEEPPKHEPTMKEMDEIIKINNFQHDIRAVVTNCCFQSASHGGQRYAGDFMIDAETLMNEDSKGLYVWSLTEMGSHLTKVDPESEIKSTFRYNSGKKVVILKLVDMTNHTIRDTTEDEITKLFDALKGLIKSGYTYVANKEEVKS